MNEDDELSDVHRPDTQFEGGPDATAESQPVPDSDETPVEELRGEESIAGYNTEAEIGPVTVPVVPVVEPKDEETVDQVGCEIADSEIAKEADVRVESSPKHIEPILEEGIRMEYVEKDTESEVSVAEPEELLPMGYLEKNTEAGVQVTEPKREELIIEEGPTMAGMYTGTEMGKMETESEAGETDNEVEASIGGIGLEAVARDSEAADHESEVDEGEKEVQEAEVDEAEKEVQEAEEDAAMAEAAMAEAAMAEAAMVEMEAAKAEVEQVEVESEAEADTEVMEEETETGLADAERETEVADAETETEVADVETETEVADVETETEVADLETETEVADAETETEVAEAADMEMEVAEASKAGGGKRKRGRNSKAPARVPPRKKVEEDVCFICFDGGELVLCDRRGCPKAYHPSCVNRDEAFFKAKGRWNCGWHICSMCEKNARYMCYTCTYSLCKGCIKNAVILCVRGNKGFCEACMRTVLLIEQNEQGNKEMGQVDFDDKNSWEYLFKDYWTDLKEKLSLTSDELSQAKNPWRASDVLAIRQQESPHNIHDANNEAGSGSDRSESLVASKPKRRKGKRLSKSFPKEAGLPLAVFEETAEPVAAEWASKELLEFVMHMKNGDGSVLSQFDVQALLLDYIKRNKLRDPRRKSQIICDSRLENLFGKARVGHFEMLKLLESHFLIKKDSQVDDLQGNVVDNESSPFEGDGNADILTKSSKDRKRKMRKKGDRGPQSNLEEYAAIDMHNINLIYLRRNLMEELLGDSQQLPDKVVGSFVRIRISGTGQKQDIYRLVQVVGTSKAAEPYRVGKRTTDFMLEILNLNKVEVISIDIISNQDFTEDECKRLRQSIKCGLINRLSVGDVLEKAMALHAVRVSDWMETEIVRLSHLRDRASEKGRRKELRECVEKLQLLKTAGERQRRLEEIPEVHADANMDPSHESEEEDEEDDFRRQEVYTRPRGSGFDRRGREPISPGTGGSASNDSWAGGIKNSGKNPELSRNLFVKDYMKSGEDFAAADIVRESSRNQGRDWDIQQLNTGEKLKTLMNSEASGWSAPRSAALTQSTAKVGETDKVWHYQDPSGKVQGPFSMVQLRKWSKSGYFPVDLRIWKATESKDDSLLLTDALVDYFPKEQAPVDGGLNPQAPSAHSSKPYGTPLPQGREVQSGERTKFDSNLESKVHNAVGSIPSLVVSRDRRGSDHGSGNDSLNLPSPTPTLNTAGGNGNGPHLGSSSFPRGNGMMLHSSPLTPQRSQMTDPSSPTPLINPAVTLGSLNQQSRSPEYKEQNVVNTVLPTSVSNSHVFLSSANESQGVQPNIHSRVAPDMAGGLMDAAPDALKANSDLPNLVQSVTAPDPNIETYGRVPGSVSVPTSMQQSSYGQWAPSPSPVNLSLPFNALNPAGSFPTPGPPSNPWRPPSNQLEMGSNVQAPVPQNLPWSMGVAQNQSAAPNLRAENPNTTWGPNMNWVGQGPAPGAPNMNWVGQGPAPGGPNMNWGPVLQGHSAPQGPAQVASNMNWGAVGQGPPAGNANPNMNWGAPGQGPVPGNANPGFVGPNGNSGMWGGDQNQNGDRFRRDGGFQGGDTGQGSGRPWNRQSSFGGGGSRGPPSGNRDRVCRFHENGHCKKGANCNYLHP